MMRFRERIEKFISSRFPDNSFVRSVGILTGGTIFAHGLTLLILPILTRLYTPDDFAVLAVYAAILGIVTTVSTLRYNIAITLPAKDEDGLALLLVALGSALTISALVAIPVIAIPDHISRWLNMPDIKPLLWLIPLGVLLASAYNALQYWTTRNKRFGLITRTRITRASAMSATQLGFGLLHPSPFGLVFGHMLYGGIGIVGLVRDFFRNDRQLLNAQSKARIISAAKQYRGFAIYSTPEALFNSAGAQLPIILIAAAAAGPEAGYLMLAMRVLGAPMALVGMSVSQVYLANAAQYDRDGILASETRKIMKSLFLYGGPPIIATGIIAPFLFPYVFGQNWARAGILIAWMTPWFVAQFVASPMMSLLHVTGRLKMALILQIGGLVLRVMPILLFLAYMPSLVSEVYSLASFLFYMICIQLILWRVAK